MAYRTKTEDDPRAVGVAGAADIHGVSTATIWRRLRDGSLPFYRVGSGHNAPIRILVSDVLALGVPGQADGVERTEEQKREARSQAIKAGKRRAHAP